MQRQWRDLQWVDHFETVTGWLSLPDGWAVESADQSKRESRWVGDEAAAERPCQWEWPRGNAQHGQWVTKWVVTYSKSGSNGHRLWGSQKIFTSSISTVWNPLQMPIPTAVAVAVTIPGLAVISAPIPVRPVADTVTAGLDLEWGWDYSGGGGRDQSDRRSSEGIYRISPTIQWQS